MVNIPPLSIDKILQKNKELDAKEALGGANLFDLKKDFEVDNQDGGDGIKDQAPPQI